MTATTLHGQQSGRLSPRPQRPTLTDNQGVARSETTTGSRIALAEDDVLLREGLASLLERNGHEVVGRAGDAGELVKLVREQKPDRAIIDIRMPPTNTTEGLDAARMIREELPGTAILLLSAHVEMEHAMISSPAASGADIC